MPNKLSESLAKIALPAPRKIFLPPLPGMETEPLPIPEIKLESFDPQAYLAGGAGNAAPNVEDLLEPTEESLGSTLESAENAPESVIESFNGISTDFFAVPTTSNEELDNMNDSTNPVEDVSSTVVVEDFGIPSDLFNVPVAETTLDPNNSGTAFYNTDGVEADTFSSTPNAEETHNTTNLDNFFASAEQPQQTFGGEIFNADPTSQIFGNVPTNEPVSFPNNETQENTTFNAPAVFADSSASSAFTQDVAPTPELLGFDPSKYLGGGNKSSVAPTIGISAADLPSAQTVSAPAPAVSETNSTSIEDYGDMQETNTNVFVKDVNSMEEISTPDAAPSFDNDDTPEENNGNDTMQILRELATLKELF
jgi:hypothetical protein